jgi:hypothetical protein
MEFAEFLKFLHILLFTTLAGVLQVALLSFLFVLVSGDWKKVKTKVFLCLRMSPIIFTPFYVTKSWDYLHLHYGSLPIMLIAFICCVTCIFICGPAFAAVFTIQKIFGRFFAAIAFIIVLFYICLKRV